MAETEKPGLTVVNSPPRYDYKNNVINVLKATVEGRGGRTITPRPKRIRDELTKATKQQREIRRNARDGIGYNTISRKESDFFDGDETEMTDDVSSISEGEKISTWTFRNELEKWEEDLIREEEKLNEKVKKSKIQQEKAKELKEDMDKFEQQFSVIIKEHESQLLEEQFQNTGFMSVLKTKQGKLVDWRMKFLADIEEVRKLHSSEDTKLSLEYENLRAKIENSPARTASVLGQLLKEAKIRTLKSRDSFRPRGSSSLTNSPATLRNTVDPNIMIPTINILQNEDANLMFENENDDESSSSEFYSLSEEDDKDTEDWVFEEEDNN